MMKALSLFAAIGAGIATGLAGWWVGTASLDWIKAHPDAVARTHPWLFVAILGLVAFGMMKRRRRGTM